MDHFIYDKRLGRKRRILYDNGTPFSTKMLLQDLQELRRHIMSDKPGVVVIDGFLGTGKTTLGVQLQKVYSGKPFDFERQIGQGGQDFQDKFDAIIQSKLDGGIYDEAGDLDSRRAITEFNNNVNRFFDMSRVYKKQITLCLPCVRSLDSRVFDKGIVQFLIHIDRREETFGHFAVYDFNQIMWLRYRMGQEINPMQAYKKVEPVYYGEFLDLPPDEQKKLYEITRAAKDGFREEALAKGADLMTAQEIGRRLGRTKQWVNLRLREMRLEPQKFIGTRRYYDSIVFERLKARVK